MRCLWYCLLNYALRTQRCKCCPHQVNHCVKTTQWFNGLLRNNMYQFFKCCAWSSNFFVRLLHMSDAFCKSSFFFLNYLTFVYDGDKWSSYCCFGICVSSVLLLCSNENLPCVSWNLRISVFSSNSFITSNM